jgi:hypothetical protein
MADALTLSDEARSILRLHLAGRPLVRRSTQPESLPVKSIEETQKAYRELVRAGLMDPVSSFAWGAESHYRLTWEAYERREEWLSHGSDLSHPRP